MHALCSTKSTRLISSAKLEQQFTMRLNFWQGHYTFSPKLLGLLTRTHTVHAVESTIPQSAISQSWIAQILRLLFARFMYFCYYYSLGAKKCNYKLWTRASVDGIITRTKWLCWNCVFSHCSLGNYCLALLKCSCLYLVRSVHAPTWNFKARQARGVFWQQKGFRDEKY